jgi:hypothetical protein
MSASRLSRVHSTANGSHNGDSAVLLTLDVQEPIVLGYLHRFGEEDRPAKALEALKVGVIAIESASPTLDTRVVEQKFNEVEERIKECTDEFNKEVAAKLAEYFKKDSGVVPKSLDGLLGERGTLAQTFNRYFDPTEGRLGRLIDNYVGPNSEFGKTVNPRNKDGLIALIEAKVSALVQEKLNGVLKEFSLNESDSAMSRLKEMLEKGFGALNLALVGKSAKDEEAGRGHIKGLVFEVQLYERIAEWGRQFGDETQLVRGTPGSLKQKVGDHLITLGETTGAPGVKIVVETKDQACSLKEAVAELQKAKKNRDAASGIFVYSKGQEPAEIGDFRRIGEDFYCTADKDAVESCGSLLFFQAAYEISRAQAVATARKECNGKLDLARIEQHIEALIGWLPRVGDVLTKAGTVRKSGEAIESTAKDLKEDMQVRLHCIRELLAAESD